MSDKEIQPWILKAAKAIDKSVLRYDTPEIEADPITFAAQIIANHAPDLVRNLRNALSYIKRTPLNGEHAHSADGSISCTGCCIVAEIEHELDLSHTPDLRAELATAKKELANETYMNLTLRQQVEGLMGPAQRCDTAESALARSQEALRTTQELLKKAGERIWEHHAIGFIMRAAEKLTGSCELCRDGIFQQIEAVLSSPAPATEDYAVSSANELASAAFALGRAQPTGQPDARQRIYDYFAQHKIEVRRNQPADLELIAECERLRSANMELQTRLTIAVENEAASRVPALEQKSWEAGRDAVLAELSADLAAELKAEVQFPAAPASVLPEPAKEALCEEHGYVSKAICPECAKEATDGKR